LKQCYKEGLLDNARYNNLIAVRVRKPKSVDEVKRYTIANCALEAKFTRTTSNGGVGGSKKKEKQKGRNKNNDNINNNGIPTDHSASDVSSAIIIDDDYDDDDDDDDGIVISRDAVHEKRHGVDNSMDEINSDIADSDSKSDDGFLLKNPFSALL
jgi:hypothetical protein